MVVKKNLKRMSSHKAKLNVSSGNFAKDELFENWITKKLLASHIGMSISFVNKYMKEGLPYRRRGRSVRFRVFEVEDWLQRRFTQ
jgi:predicted DNA-binding transcriptional regulator AlpA